MADIEVLYKLYFHDVFRYVCRLCGSSDVAEEITAETFFRALTAIDGFRGECDIRVWLCRIAKNIYYSGLRKRKKLVPLPDAEPADETAGADELIADKSDASLIRRLVHELGEPYKEVFMLRVFTESDFRSIGELFGRSENWACVVYHRAKARIIGRMKEIEKEDGSK